MKKWKRMLALLLALAMLFALAACGNSDSDDDDEDDGSRRSSKKTTKKSTACEVLRETIDNTVTSNGVEEYHQFIVKEYDERGLITSMTYDENGEEHSVSFSYGFDEHNVLNHVSGEFNGKALEVFIENRYENNKLIEAVVVDIVLDGESFREEGYLDAYDPDASIVVFAVIPAVKQLIGMYTGYQNCTLRFGDTWNLSRYEDGRNVYDYSITRDIATETINEYSRGETSTTTNSYRYDGGEFSQLSGMTMVTDSKNQIARGALYVPGTEIPIEASFVYEDHTDARSGEKIREAYIDGDSVRRFIEENAELLGEVSDSEINGMLSMLRTMPLFRYTLDRRNRVVKAENLMGSITSSMNQTSISYFDEQGRLIRVETNIDRGNDGYHYCYITETEYR